MVNTAVLHRGAHLCQSEVGITILAAIGLHKVGFQPAAPDRYVEKGLKPPEMY